MANHRACPRWIHLFTDKLMANTKEESATKVKSLSDAQKKVAEWKSKGERVVFTNGCFDIIHMGHVDYLEKARNLGDHLVVGLNTDSSVSRFKGAERPIQDQK